MTTRGDDEASKGETSTFWVPPPFLVVGSLRLHLAGGLMRFWNVRIFVRALSLFRDRGLESVAPPVCVVCLSV